MAYFVKSLAWRIITVGDIWCTDISFMKTKHIDCKMTCDLTWFPLKSDMSTFKSSSRPFQCNYKTSFLR